MAYVNGMTASNNAFSWTCQPNINEVKPHNTRHRTKSIGFLLDFQSLYKHGWKWQINILINAMVNNIYHINKKIKNSILESIES